MDSLIYENFKLGNSVEVFLKGMSLPIEARFTKCSRNGILLRSESGRKIVVPISEVLMIRHAAIIPTKKENKPGKVFTPSKPNETQNFGDNEEIIENKPYDTPADPEVDEVDTPTEETSNIFKLPTERPQLKIVGSIELDETETARKRFKEPQSEYTRPELQDDFLDTELPAMGVLKSIGPVYGYIKVEGQPDIYVNRGEFIFFPEEESILEPGMPLVYSTGTNWKGQMARCVHRPCTVGEQLDLIDDLIMTDTRNARLLATQLMNIFPESEEIADILESYPQL